MSFFPWSSCITLSHPEDRCKNTHAPTHTQTHMQVNTHILPSNLPPFYSATKQRGEKIFKEPLMDYDPPGPQWKKYNWEVGVAGFWVLAEWCSVREFEIQMIKLIPERIVVNLKIVFKICSWTLVFNLLACIFQMPSLNGLIRHFKTRSAHNICVTVLRIQNQSIYTEESHPVL